MPGKKKEGIAGGISGGGSFLWTKGVPGATRSWRGSLVSGDRRHLMKKVCSVSGATDGEGVEERSLFLEQGEDQEEKTIWSKMMVSGVLDKGIWRRGTG